jgi:hypothetical protein
MVLSCRAAKVLAPPTSLRLQAVARLLPKREGSCSDAFASIDPACSIPEEAINRSTVQPDVRTARGRFGLVSVPVSVRHRKWLKLVELGGTGFAHKSS